MVCEVEAGGGRRGPAGAGFSYSVGVGERPSGPSSTITPHPACSGPRRSPEHAGINSGGSCTTRVPVSAPCWPPFTPRFGTWSAKRLNLPPWGENIYSTYRFREHLAQGGATWSRRTWSGWAGSPSGWRSRCWPGHFPCPWPRTSSSSSRPSCSAASRTAACWRTWKEVRPLCTPGTVSPSTAPGSSPGARIARIIDRLGPPHQLKSPEAGRRQVLPLRSGLDKLPALVLTYC